MGRGRGPGLFTQHWLELHSCSNRGAFPSAPPAGPGQGDVQKGREGGFKSEFSEPPAGPCSLKNSQLPFHLTRPSAVTQASFLLFSSPSPWDRFHAFWVLTCIAALFYPVFMSCGWDSSASLDWGLLLRTLLHRAEHTEGAWWRAVWRNAIKWDEMERGGIGWHGQSQSCLWAEAWLYTDYCRKHLAHEDCFVLTPWPQCPLWDINLPTKSSHGQNIVRWEMLVLSVDPVLWAAPTAPTPHPSHLTV